MGTNPFVQNLILCRTAAAADLKIYVFNFQVVLKDDSQLLSAHNIRPATSSIHVFPKPPTTSNDTRSEENLAPKMTDDEMQQFMIAFGMAVSICLFQRQRSISPLFLAKSEHVVHVNRKGRHPED